MKRAQRPINAVARLTGERMADQHGNVVGDAAHLMPPFAGVGVNIGLLDAVELAETLSASGKSDLPGAIQNYERKMYRYAAEAQAGTASAELDIHSDKTFAELHADRDSQHQTIGV